MLLGARQSSFSTLWISHGSIQVINPSAPGTQSMPAGQIVCPQSNRTDREAGPDLAFKEGSRHSKDPGVFLQTWGCGQGKSGRAHSSMSTQPLSVDHL